MHGTTARLYIKEGQEEAFIAHMAERAAEPRPPGQNSTYLIEWRKDSREFMMVTLFDDYELYHDYSHTPESDAKYQKMAEFFERDPVWLDGPIKAMGK